MAKSLSHGFWLAVLVHFLNVSVKNALADERTKVPCPVVNTLTKAVVCCQTTHNTTQNRRCKMLFPKESLPAMPGTWDLQSYKEAKLSWLKHSSDDINSTCCCTEKEHLILPGRVASADSNGLSQKLDVVQNSSGHVQPLVVRTCVEQPCSRKANDTLFSCIQKFSGRYLYTEDTLYKGLMGLEKVLVPDGCRCTELVKKHNSVVKESINDFWEDRSDIQDTLSVKIPIPSKDEFPSSAEVNTVHKTQKNDSMLDRYSSFKRKAIPYSINEMSPGFSEVSTTVIPSSTLVNYSMDSFNNVGSSYVHDLLDYLPDNIPGVFLEQYSNIPENIPGAFLEQLYKDLYVEVPEQAVDNVKEIYGYGNNNEVNSKTLLNMALQKNCSNCSSQFHNTSINSQSNFNYTYHQPQPPMLFPDLPSSLFDQGFNGLKFLNSLDLKKFILKMGLLSGSFGRMTTAEIIQNILTLVPKSEQAYAQAAAERMMILETEYMKTSLRMMEILVNCTGSLDNIADRKFTKSISGFDETGRFEHIDSPIGKPAFLDDEDNFEHHFLNELNNLSSSLGNATASAETEHNILSTLSQVGSSSPVRDLSQLTIGSNLEKITMLEEQLHTALANFIFEEAWANLSCMVPDTIEELISEAKILPSLIREELNIQAKGLVDINKLTERIVGSIIMCHFPDLEKALKSGRLVTAISGGVMAAEILNQEINIIQDMMQGLLDTGDVRKIVNILRWSVQPTESKSRRNFLSFRDEMRIDYISKILNNSIGEYIEFLKGKAVDGDSSSNDNLEVGTINEDSVEDVTRNEIERDIITGGSTIEISSTTEYAYSDSSVVDVSTSNTVTASEYDTNDNQTTEVSNDYIEEIDVVDSENSYSSTVQEIKDDITGYTTSDDNYNSTVDYTYKETTDYPSYNVSEEEDFESNNDDAIPPVSSQEIVENTERTTQNSTENLSTVGPVITVKDLEVTEITTTSKEDDLNVERILPDYNYKETGDYPYDENYDNEEGVFGGNGVNNSQEVKDTTTVRPVPDYDYKETGDYPYDINYDDEEGIFGNRIQEVKEDNSTMRENTTAVTTIPDYNYKDIGDYPYDNYGDVSNSQEVREDTSTIRPTPDYDYKEIGDYPYDVNYDNEKGVFEADNIILDDLNTDNSTVSNESEDKNVTGSDNISENEDSSPGDVIELGRNEKAELPLNNKQKPSDEVSGSDEVKNKEDTLHFDMQKNESNSANDLNIATNTEDESINHKYPVNEEQRDEEDKPEELSDNRIDSSDEDASGNKDDVSAALLPYVPGNQVASASSSLLHKNISLPEEEYNPIVDIQPIDLQMLFPNLVV